MRMYVKKSKERDENNNPIYEEFNLEDKDALLIEAIDNLSNEIKLLRMK